MNETPMEWAESTTRRARKIQSNLLDQSTAPSAVDDLMQLQYDLAAVKRKADAWDELQASLEKTAAEHAAGVRRKIDDADAMRLWRAEALEAELEISENCISVHKTYIAARTARINAGLK